MQKIQKYSDNEINHDKMFVIYYYVHYKQRSRILNNRTQFNPLYLMPVSDVPFRVGLLWNDPQSFTSFSSSITSSRRQPEVNEVHVVTRGIICSFACNCQLKLAKDRMTLRVHYQTRRCDPINVDWLRTS